ncbi:hypothetical protein SDC9_121736 [bioreactor metagenome]|uniref:Uncharacterized protein n=1 Tax=bioreactor metagenome TaxID=1076179 RepID=A0A645CCS6_9ZZZZ
MDIFDTGNIYTPAVVCFSIPVNIQFYGIYYAVVIGVDPFIIHIPFAVTVKIDIYPSKVTVLYAYFLFCRIIIVGIGLFRMKYQFISFVERSASGASDLGHKNIFILITFGDDPFPAGNRIIDIFPRHIQVYFIPCE